MKRLLQTRFVPKYYMQEFYFKLQSLSQGGMCVEDYVKEFEKLMIRCELQPQEQTIAKFIGGLQKGIAVVVELQNDTTFKDVIKLAIKVERQSKRFSSKQVVTQPTRSKAITPSWSAS